MRVVGGEARGRRLVAPQGRNTRPTSDRAREGMFSTLQTLTGPLAGKRFADLFAGSGAVGVEALSRGAAHVLFVDHDAKAVRSVRLNVSSVGQPGAEVRSGKVEAVLSAPPDAPYDVVFIDPPYTVPVEPLLARLLAHEWLGHDALVVVERETRTEWGWPAGWEGLRERRYGEGTLWYGRPAPVREDG